jgi:hypothetical protein
MSANAALRVPALRRYLLGQLPSVTCSWIQVVALSWIVVETGLGLVAAAYAIAAASDRLDLTVIGRALETRPSSVAFLRFR